jgi:hypothetical protein
MKLFGRGQTSIPEFLVIVGGYTICCLILLGIGTTNITWLTDFAKFILPISVIAVIALDKNRFGNIRFISIILGAVAVWLPLSIAKVIPDVLNIAQYFNTIEAKFVAFLVCEGCMLIIAKQD